MILPTNTPHGSTPAGTPANIASGSTAAPGATVPGAPVDPVQQTGFDRVDALANETGAVGSDEVARITPREAIASHETGRLPHVGDAQNPTADGHGVLPERTHTGYKVPSSTKIESATAGEMAQLRLEMRAWWERLDAREGALAGDLRTEIKRLHDWLTRRLSEHAANGGAIDLPQ